MLFSDPLKKKTHREASKEGVQVHTDEDDIEDPLDHNYRDHGRQGAILASEQTMEKEGLEPELEVDPELLAEHREKLKRMASDAP